MTQTLKTHKEAIISSVIMAVISVAVTTFVLNWNRLDNAVTTDQLNEAIEQSAEDVLNRSRRYTDDQIEAAFKYLDETNKLRDDKVMKLLESMDDRLDRIDKRIQ